MAIVSLAVLQRPEKDVLVEVTVWCQVYAHQAAALLVRAYRVVQLDDIQLASHHGMQNREINSFILRYYLKASF